MTTLQSREDALLRRVKAVDWARLKFCFAATALCMLLAHGFAWFNLFPSHDATILFFDADVVMLQLGRWAVACVSYTWMLPVVWFSIQRFLTAQS